MNEAWPPIVEALEAAGWLAGENIGGCCVLAPRPVASNDSWHRAATVVFRIVSAVRYKTGAAYANFLRNQSLLLYSSYFSYFMVPPLTVQDRACMNAAQTL